MASDADIHNSEVGHNAVTACCVFDQGAKRVAEAIASGKMFSSEAWNEATRQTRPLLDLLCENAEIMAHVSRDQLAAMCDPTNYLGQSGVMVDRVLAQMAG